MGPCSVHTGAPKGRLWNRLGRGPLYRTWTLNDFWNPGCSYVTQGYPHLQLPSRKLPGWACQTTSKAAWRVGRQRFSAGSLPMADAAAWLAPWWWAGAHLLSSWVGSWPQPQPGIWVAESAGAGAGAGVVAGRWGLPSCPGSELRSVPC